MLRGLLAAVVALFVLTSSVLADENAGKNSAIEDLRQKGYSVKSVTPIFSQLLMISVPQGFKPAFENTKDIHYIQEWVLEGETVNKWTQMITLTGAKGLAAKPNVTPLVFANGMAGGYKRSCPDSFSATGLGTIKLSGYDAFAAVMSCGVAIPTGEPYSESMLLVVLKGERDYYTIQWAERGDFSRTPIKFDEAKWADKLKKLSPIKLCPIVPGEPAPYPSCANRM